MGEDDAEAFCRWVVSSQWRCLSRHRADIERIAREGPQDQQDILLCRLLACAVIAEQLLRDQDDGEDADPDRPA